MNYILQIIDNLNIKDVKVCSNDKDIITIRNFYFKITIKKVNNFEVYLFKKWNLSIFGKLIFKKRVTHFNNVHDIVTNSLQKNNILINILNFFPN